VRGGTSPGDGSKRVSVIHPHADPAAGTYFLVFVTFSKLWGLAMAFAEPLPR
jgi:hypothetical protein